VSKFKATSTKYDITRATCDTAGYSTLPKDPVSTHSASAITP